MKLGIHSAAFVKDWAEDIIPYIKECHSRGYEVIEVSLNDLGKPWDVKHIPRHRI